MYVRLLVCIALLSFGCDFRDSRRSTGEAAIGNGGGALSLDNGVAVDVPPGAVDVETRFTAVTTLADGLPETMTAAGPMVTFGPEGQRFALPVRIAVPARAEPLVLLTRPGAGEPWTRVDGAVYDETAGVVTADVMHFSDFVPAMAAPSGDGGTPDPDAGVDCADPAFARDPACVPPPVILPGCDAVAQDCAAGEKCIPTDQENGYDWGDGRPARCVPAGTETMGATCDAADDCERGLSCVFATMHDEVATWFSLEEDYLPMYDSICLRVCDLGDPSACSDIGSICNPVQLWGFSGREVNEVYGVCAPAPGPPPPR